jgi:hypothetical protein
MRLMVLARRFRLSSKPIGTTGTARGAIITVIAGEPQS